MNMFTNALKSIRCFDPTAKKIQTNLIRKRFKGAEGVALWLRAQILQRTWVWFLEPTSEGLQLPVTPVLEDLMPSEPLGNYTYTYVVCANLCKHMYIHMGNKSI